MRFWVESWDPSYGAENANDGAGPAEASTAELDTDVELPADSWTALPSPPELRAPRTVLMVDGVRRRDAVVWTTDHSGAPHPGLAVSYAAGVVRCDLDRGLATLPAPPQVRRGLFTTSPSAETLECGRIRYEVHQLGAGDFMQLSAAVQTPLSALEVAVAAAARGADDGDTADLLVVDGPLRGREHLPRAIGYIKSHRRTYLPAELAAVVTGLPPGHRSPVFRLGTNWHRYTWYVRLPGGSGAPWSGLVRAECPVDLPVNRAVMLADLSVVTLPRFAATAYKDARAPQNLVPIAGLEQRLRKVLGDARLLHRALTRAATASAPA